MRNIVVGYIIFIIAIMALWWTIIPTQEELIDRRKDAQFLNTVRSLETQILARYGIPNQTGNLTTSIFTYHNVSITNWELKNNRTLVVMNFSVSNLYRVRRYGLVIDEYYGLSTNKTISAYLENDAWFLNTSSLRTLE